MTKESAYLFRTVEPDDAQLICDIETRAYGFPTEPVAEDLDLYRSDIQSQKELIDSNVWQEGFIIFNGDTPAGCMLIEPKLLTGETVYQHISNFFTVPDERGFGLLKAVIGRLRDTQHPDYSYVYSVDAMIDTAYKGLVQPKVKEWMGKQGVMNSKKLDPKHYMKWKLSARSLLYGNNLTLQCSYRF